MSAFVHRPQHVVGPRDMPGSEMAEDQEPGWRKGKRVMSPIDVCLVSQHFHPVYAGPALRFRRYAPTLRAYNVRLRVFSASDSDVTLSSNRASDQKTPSPAGLYAPEVVDDIRVQRVRVQRAWGKRRREWTFERALLKYCRDSRSRPQLLQFLSLSPGSVWALWQLRRMGIPSVFTATLLSEMSLKPWKRTLQYLYWHVPYELVTCVVVSSDVMRKALLAIGVRNRIEVISNGVDLERFRPATVQERNALRAQYGIRPDDEVVAFVGSISPRKGIDLLAEAWLIVSSRRPRARLLLVGPRHDEIRPDEPVSEFLTKVSGLLHQSSSKGRVTFTGAVEDVAPYLRLADVFVFPSRREGMPNVVPEAFACGVASVLTPFLGIPAEFGQPGADYLLARHDAVELAGAILRLLESPARKADLGVRARRWVERHLDMKRSVASYSQLYHELVAHSATDS